MCDAYGMDPLGNRIVKNKGVRLRQKEPGIKHPSNKLAHGVEIELLKAENKKLWKAVNELRRDIL